MLVLGVAIAITLAFPARDGLSDGFAYAPNFITKIIAESTGRDPVGLLDIPSKGEDVDASAVDASTADDATTSIRRKKSGRIEGPITTRFPPEPNGYLHLGHAKAVSFNFAVAKMFPDGGGGCHMRLDDTNPSKENQEYIDSILEDVRWIQSGTAPFEVPVPVPSQSETDDNANADDDEALDLQNRGPWIGKVHKTSDNFELIYDCAKELVKSGDAYMESLNAEEMREYRGSLTEPGKDSPYRGRSVQENLDMLEKVSGIELNRIELNRCKA